MGNALRVFNLSSNECYLKDDRHLLSGITFTLDEKDCLGAISKFPDESKVLLEALANLREIYGGYFTYQYDEGKKKIKLALDHVFYIDATSALIDDMNVLEYLMYITGKFKVKDVKRQQVIFNMLLDYGFKDISLSEIAILTRNERMLLTVFSTLFSSSQFLIINLNYYNFSDAEISTLRKIIARLCQEKTIILSSVQAKLIGMCCNKVLFIDQGKPKFFGTTLEMQQEYDNVMFILRDKNIDVLYEKTKAAFPNLLVKKEGGMVLICSVDGKYINNTTLYQTLAIHNIFPGEVKINLGRVSNAIEELLKDDDLQ